MDSPSSRLAWHASRTDIDRPTIDGRTVGDNHDNSGLGIYCATKPMDYICGFGGFIHELSVKPAARVLSMSVSDLNQMGRDGDRAWFEAHGVRLAEDYDLIELVEVYGLVEQVIILRDDAVISSRKLTPEQFQEIAIDHSAYMREVRANAKHLGF